MDKLDEWMKRTFSSDPSIKDQKQKEAFVKPPVQNVQNKKQPIQKNNRKNTQNRRQSNQQGFKQNKPYRSFKKPFKKGPVQNAQNLQNQQQNSKPYKAFKKPFNKMLVQNAQNRPQPSQQTPYKPFKKAPVQNTQNVQNRKQPNRKSYKPFKKASVQNAKPQPAPTPKTIILKNKLKVIPLGGLDEVGKNMMVFEYEDDIIIVDMGLEFPSEDLFGIDYVIPDVSYLEENKKRIRGIVLTHGHLDHIGGVPYILPKLDFPPIYSARLTIGLVEKRIQEFKQTKLASLRTINPDEPLKLGKFLIRFFRVDHSIPDALGVIIETPVGKFVHTGDFKFDETPARNQQKADIDKMIALGNQNIIGLFCESTNALKEGHSMSEREVGNVLDGIIGGAQGRVIVASFSSQIGRMQQIMDSAAKYNRKVYISGRSMKTNVEICSRLGCLHMQKDITSDVKKYKGSSQSDKNTLILTTGSQGEPISALSRMADQEHPHVKIKKGDTVILSSSAIIGNERSIYSVINKLSILGAEVIHNQIMDVHTSGHGKQEELKRMIDYVKPKYLIPIHGEYFMRKELARLARERCNIPDDKIIMIENGDVIVSEKGVVAKSQEKVDTKYILIDGNGEGQMGSQVQIDREMMSENGALVILIHIQRKTGKLQKTPDVVSRGFVYMHESKEITEEIAAIAGEAYRAIQKKNQGATRQDIKLYIKQSVDKYTQKKIERRPLIVPLIIES